MRTEVNFKAREINIFRKYKKDESGLHTIKVAEKETTPQRTSQNSCADTKPLAQSMEFVSAVPIIIIKKDKS